MKLEAVKVLYRAHDIVLQVFVSPRSHRIAVTHLKLKLPCRAIAASYEPSTRVLVCMFAEQGDTEATMGFYCFDVEFKQLQKQGQITVPATVRFSDHNTLASQIPCILLPSSATSDAAVATKVRVLSISTSQNLLHSCYVLLSQCM